MISFIGNFHALHKTSGGQSSSDQQLQKYLQSKITLANNAKFLKN